MRRTDYRRRMMRVNNQLEEQIQKAAQSELNWLFRQYQYKVRRINQFRPKINTARPKLTKSYVANADLWDEFRKRMRTSIMRTIKDMLPILLALPTDQFKEYAVNFNSDDLAAQILPEIGMRITQVETSIKRSVGRKVLAWYNSPGVTMQSLINQIKEDNFTPARAQLIARTEVTYLNSRVSDLIAEQIGSTEWVFDSRNDSKVCIKPIVGPDGKMYNGCRALHGKTFKQGMKKPPDGSHIGCRCSAIDLPPKPKTALEPNPIMEFGKFDPSEARDKNGEWTDGGAGGGSGGESSDTPAPNKNGGNLPKEKQKEIINSAKDAEFPAEKLLELRGENNKKLSTFLKDNIVKLPQSNPYYKKIYKEIHHRDMEDTDDFEVAEDDVRQKEKANIVDNISKVSGISKDKASAYVGQWAETSNDTNIDSINIQKAASEEFGIELSDWQKHQDIRAEKMAELRNPIVKNKFIKEYGNYADNFEKEYRDGVARLRNKNPKMGDLEARSAFEGSKEFKEINPLDKMPDSDYFDEKGFWDTPPSDYGGLYTRDYYASKLLNDVVGGKGTRDFKHDIETQTISSYIDTELAGTQEDYKKFLKGMYDNTQSQLEASGLKPDDEITIFRGTNENIPPGLLGAEGTIHGNALESWSLSPVVADRFGNHTISTQVKVKDILSTFTSGFGCMSECEVVILGGKPYQATIVREK